MRRYQPPPANSRGKHRPAVTACVPKSLQRAEAEGWRLGWDSSGQQEGAFGLTYFWTASVIKEYLTLIRQP